MERPEDLLDRDAEWSALVAAWERKGPALVLVLGRRRVGKTHLLTRFAERVGGLYYQATNRTENEQLSRISRIVGRHFDDPALGHGVPFPDWEALFAYVAERARGSPFLIVLDEFPYLADSAPALPSILQSLWDHEWPRTRIRLVLSGSHITAMERLEGVDQPLYGRRTARLALEPFDPSRVSHFLADHSPRDRLRAYGIFGGLPGNLALLDREAELSRNVTEHILQPTGRLHDEAQHLLDAYLAGAEVHYSIIGAIAGGERTWGGISRRVGRIGGSLKRALDGLIDMRLVSRVVPITERRPQKSKRAIYRIADPYLAFWHRFILPLLSGGMLVNTAGPALWRTEIAPGLDDYMGGVFEEACRSLVQRSAGRLPFEPLRVGEWWDAASQNEIDVVALGENGEVLVGECKWGGAYRRDLDSLRARADLLLRELTGVREVHYALFSGRETHRSLSREIETGEFLYFDAESVVRP
ncbi:MAG TPA: ATP-binding protein [Gemmatimonadota bacterium]|nr:ATP-binding protein [Gemmatimonadota bacterium]